MSFPILDLPIIKGVHVRDILTAGVTNPAMDPHMLANPKAGPEWSGKIS